MNHLPSSIIKIFYKILNKELIKVGVTESNVPVLVHR